MSNKNDNNTSHSPQLRFPGFTGEWTEKKLGEIGEFIRGLSYNNAEITSEISSTLVIRSNNIIQDRDVDYKCGLQYVTKNPSPEQVLKKGDIAICLANGSSNLVGKSASFDGKYHGVATVGAFCGIYRSDSPIVKYLVQTSEYKEKINLIKQGGNGALANLYGKDILLLTFNVPPSPIEQQKIADCLSSLDDMITAQASKTEALREYKRGLMQQLFPANGATTPQLRFPGFTGEWKEKKWGEIYEKHNEKNDLSFGVDKVISVANMYYKQDANVGNDDYLRTYNIFRLGDIAYEGNKSSNFAYGRFVENTIGDGIVSHVFDVYRPITADYCIDYWKYAINYEPIMRPILEKATIKSTMMNNLIAKDFLRQSILLPPTLAEQQKIADCLSSLDDMITAQASKTEALREYKRGLMQQLFPQPSK